MKPIILDTHILLWWLTDHSDLPAKYKKTISDSIANGALVISSITLLEIGLLVQKNKINLTRSLQAFLGDLEKAAWLQIYPLDSAVVAESVGLGDRLHRDPADRIIIATARVHGLGLLTCDQRIIESKLVQIL